MLPEHVLLLLHLVHLRLLLAPAVSHGAGGGLSGGRLQLTRPLLLHLRLLQLQLLTPLLLLHFRPDLAQVGRVYLQNGLAISGYLGGVRELVLDAAIHKQRLGVVLSRLPRLKTPWLDFGFEADAAVVVAVRLLLLQLLLGVDLLVLHPSSGVGESPLLLLLHLLLQLQLSPALWADAVPLAGRVLHGHSLLLLLLLLRNVKAVTDDGHEVCRGDAGGRGSGGGFRLAAVPVGAVPFGVGDPLELVLLLLLLLLDDESLVEAGHEGRRGRWNHSQHLVVRNSLLGACSLSRCSSFMVVFPVVFTSHFSYARIFSQVSKCLEVRAFDTSASNVRGALSS